MMGQPLQVALGSPPVEGHLPLAASPAWRGASTQLMFALRAAGCRRRFRSAARRWTLVHGDRRIPVGATWGHLCEGATLRTVVEALEHDRLQGPRMPFISWNVRWIVDPAAPLAATTVAPTSARATKAHPYEAVRGRRHHNASHQGRRWPRRHHPQVRRPTGRYQKARVGRKAAPAHGKGHAPSARRALPRAQPALAQ